MAEVDYKVDYNDERFQEVETDKQAALNSVDEAYGQVIGSTDELYQKQINATEEWGQKQQDLQNEQTDFLIEKIEQDKAQAQKDYIKEQSGAYADWQKQSNQYGVKAEQQAAAGLTGTGYSESSQVAMYNNYQNRIVAAREVFAQAKLNYDNSIKEAKLQNSSVLAEIAYQTLQTTLQLGLDNAMYNNELILEKANQKIELENEYWNRSQDVYNQIMEENKLAESVRQYEKNYELQVKEFEEQQRQWKADYDLRVDELDEKIRQFDLEIERLKAKDAEENARAIEELELQREMFEEEKRQYKKDYALKQDQLAEEKRQFEKTYALQKKTASSSSKSSGGSGGSATPNKIANTSNPNAKDVLKSVIDDPLGTLSLAALGYGPVTPERKKELLKNGEIVAIEKNGLIRYEAGPNHKSKKASTAAQKVWQGITRLVD